MRYTDDAAFSIAACISTLGGVFTAAAAAGAVATLSGAFPAVLELGPAAAAGTKVDR